MMVAAAAVVMVVVTVVVASARFNSRCPSDQAQAGQQTRDEPTPTENPVHDSLTDCLSILAKVDDHLQAIIAGDLRAMRTLHRCKARL
jgi:hypothetical protein